MIACFESFRDSRKRIRQAAGNFVWFWFSMYQSLKNPANHRPERPVGTGAITDDRVVCA